MKEKDDKVTGAQQKARKKAGVDDKAHKEKYRGKPKKASDQVLESQKRAVMEENDYSGTRSINEKHRVTEKGSKKKEEKSR